MSQEAIKAEEPLGLVADIGGTNGRFALVRAKDRGFELYEQSQYACCEFENFSGLVERYLRDCRQSTALKAVISVAGPIERNGCRLTNLGWMISGRDLQENGLFSACRLLNDFAALALALPFLQDKDLVPIGPQDLRGAKEPEKAGETGSWLVVGPGTGLGAGFLTRAGVVEGEGGHIGFAPVDELEVKLLAWFTGKYGRVSMERLLSGPGLEDLYEALATIEGHGVDRLTAERIMSKGLLGEGIERVTLQRFCAILGSYAGDMALAGGSWSGVYIGGGIAPRMVEFLSASPFRRRFEAKGRFQQKMSRVPTMLIAHETPALLGAASRLSGF